MTLTFIDLYNECAGQPWSMFDNDAENKEDFESGMRISINKAISYLWNFQPWSFRIKSTNLTTKPDKATYTMPNGSIMRKTIRGVVRYGIKFEGKYLPYEPSYELLDEETGKPESFYVDGESLCVFPTPDDRYVINIKYLKLPYGLSEDGTEIYELSEDTDYIDIPEKYEGIFKNCLISLAMMYAIADESDENYSGYLKQYEDALGILLDYCKNGLIDKNIIW